ncbi:MULTISPECIES: hypothetical protein [Spirosoma]|uniref:Pentapeptide MXKDX repeat protein n=1 Tax=Spirosoma linguale (strain ATCC 33905 / DSM 74 / LMG 10896 / Claus 1) TaxID=504472 RepID=D2QVI9_SPILD|nr:hypothetical protein [Spirosoma sp. 209]ADB42821.1 hypothetical protein Slin_6872 [Spirosoma linguale DSM 74]
MKKTIIALTLSLLLVGASFAQTQKPAKAAKKQAKAAKKMDHSKMDHSKMDHSKMKMKKDS